MEDTVNNMMLVDCRGPRNLEQLEGPNGKHGALVDSTQSAEHCYSSNQDIAGECNGQVETQQ